MTEIQTPTTTPDWPGTLIALLEHQQALMTELSGLADRQAEMIQRTQTDALLGLLSRRQQIIEEFAQAQEEMGSLTENIESRLQEVDSERRERIQSLIAEIGDCIACVMQADQRDQQALEAARNETRRELRGLDTARSARQAYLGSKSATNRFADRRG